MLLGIDYGKARIGIAISNGILARPLTIIKNESWKVLFAKIKRICDENSVKTVVFGLPLNANGTESKMSEEVRTFSEFFKEYEIVLFDERYSSLEATDINSKKVDETAAAVILQRYIDSKKV